MGAFIQLLPVIKEQLKRQRANPEPPRTLDLLLTSINRSFCSAAILYICIRMLVMPVYEWDRLMFTQLYASMVFWRLARGRLRFARISWRR